MLSKLGGNVTLPLTHGLNEQQVSIEIGLGEEWLNQALGRRDSVEDVRSGLGG